ncbi:MAG: hypothetical protein H6739_35380 [Alphaproteobacteria bacterium]|nr:hypothetical protein [Alphaproteobacteria bacterium]
MIPEPTVVHASFKVERKGGGAETIEVQFNPERLQTSLSNTLENKGKNSQVKQYVTQSTAKLSMELVFDSTHDGQDVRTQTRRLAALMMPADDKGDDSPRKVPPQVTFQWGTFSFRGVVESFRETLELFSADGVPLRAAVSLGLSKQDKAFDKPGSSGDKKTQQAAKDGTSAPEGPTGIQGLANAAGDPSAARAIAAANGVESLRHPNVDSVVISPDISSKLDPQRLLQGAGSGGLSAVAGVALGGQAQLSGAASLRTDVGATAAFKSRMRFGGLFNQEEA